MWCVPAPAALRVHVVQVLHMCLVHLMACLYIAPAGNAAPELASGIACLVCSWTCVMAFHGRVLAVRSCMEVMTPASAA